MRRIHGHAIIRHDSRGVRSNRSFERYQMIIKIIAGIHLSFLKREMRVKPFKLRAATWKMFGHGGHALSRLKYQFENLQYMPLPFSREIGIFTKRACNSWPSWLCCRVNLWMQRFANANSKVFLPYIIRKLMGQFFIVRLQQSPMARTIEKMKLHSSQKDSW